MRHDILHEFPDPRTEAAWREFLSRLEFPSYYNAPEYFHEPFWADKRPFCILAREGDRVAAALTGLHDGHQVLCGLPSRPQVAVDPDADGTAALEALVEGLGVEAGSAKLIAVYSWHSLDLTPFVARGFRSRQLQGSVVLDLTRGADALFQEFSKDRRRNIRFAEKQGISVRIAADRSDFVRAYEVYLAWRDTERKEVIGQCHSFETFVEPLRLVQNRRLFLAELSGKAIAINVFRYYPGGLFESAANSSLDEFLPLKPNDLLQWKGIEWACRQGLRRHSLGGAHPFLTRFGGALVPIVRYRVDHTLLRRHDLREMLRDTARRRLRQLSPSVQGRVRRALGRLDGQ